MVCATRLVVLLCLLAAEVRPELASSEKSAEADIKEDKVVTAESEEGRTKRQNFGNFGGQPSQQFSFNRGPFTINRGSQFISRGQPAFGGQNFQRQPPRLITSPAPFQRQNTPLLLNNDPLGLFQRNSRFQSNQRSPQTLSTPQQIIDFQRQQQRQALAGIRGNNQGFGFSRPNFSSQSFSASPNPAFQQRTRQQFRPSVQLSPQQPQGNVFQPTQLRQFNPQPFQSQGINSIQQPQALQQQQFLQQQQLQQQQLQRQQQQQLLQQLLQRQEALNQQRQQQLLQQQLQQDQLRQQLLQQQALQRQPSAPRTRQQPTTQGSFGSPVPTSQPASFGVPSQSARPPVGPATFGRPTANVQQSFSSQPVSFNSQSSVGVPLQSIPTQPPQPAPIVRPTSAPASFGVQQRPNAGVLLSQTRPQNSAPQFQAQNLAVSQFGPQRGGLAFIADDDFTIEDFRDDRTDEILDSRELFLGGGRRQLGLGANTASFSQSFSQNRGRGGFGRTRSGFQIRPDITREDLTLEVNSREFFGVRNPITTGGFQPSFGARIPRVTQEITLEDLTQENFTREDFFTIEDFDD
ncbi:putative mediator of RNA polymerase II transcription subunit 26 [Macrobrachium nipponense]|uniref:putative mediator of RNA polymerase II transcription subunit 26 n=1 Tax=Macrobrachium nipponense TaxID=159736 RepID=UPI0030C8C519